MEDVKVNNVIEDNLFGTGFVLINALAMEYIVINVPAANCLLSPSMEPFYLLQSTQSKTVYAVSKAVAENGSFSEVDPPDRKVAIQKRLNGQLQTALFKGLDCVRTFIDVESEELAIKQAYHFFQSTSFRVVRPEITKMVMS